MLCTLIQLFNVNNLRNDNLPFWQFPHVSGQCFAIACSKQGGLTFLHHGFVSIHALPVLDAKNIFRGEPENYKENNSISK